MHERSPGGVAGQGYPGSPRKSVSWPLRMSGTHLGNAGPAGAVSAREGSRLVKPYEIVGELKRFDRRNSAFARISNDPGPAARKPAANPHQDVASTPRPGYSPEDLALHAGARAPDLLLRQQWPQAAAPAAKRHEPEDWGEFTRRVKGAAAFYGASLVGVARVNPLWLYAGEGETDNAGALDGLDTAVVMAIEMDYDMIATSPAVPAAAATGKAYSQMAFAATCLGRYLTELGFRALPSGNDTALSIPLGVDAGLGELGRNGSLITKRYGPRVRLCKVFTDAALVPDRPISFGVKQCCQGCDKCADACPAGAVPRGDMTAAGPSPSSNPGVLKWYLDPDKCLAFWRVNGTSCANCISACPFNRP